MKSMFSIQEIIWANFNIAFPLSFLYCSVLHSNLVTSFTKRLKRVNKKKNQPGHLIPVTGTSETELACENGLPDISSDLKHLRTTFWFPIELENKSRVGFRFNIQVKLSRGTLMSFSPNRNPPIVENASLGFSSRQIQWHRHFT